MVGAGGIGSAVIPALAGAGVGRLTIIDDDVVELANLHRQPLFRERDAGYSKADLAAAVRSSSQPLRRSDAGAAANRCRKCAGAARRPRSGDRRQRQFRDSAGRERRLRARSAFRWFRRRRCSFRGRSACSARGPAIAASSAMRSTPRIATIARSLACWARLPAPSAISRRLLAINTIVGIGEDSAGSAPLVRRRETELAHDPYSRGPGLQGLRLSLEPGNPRDQMLRHFGLRCLPASPRRRRQ